MSKKLALLLPLLIFLLSACGTTKCIKSKKDKAFSDWETERVHALYNRR